MIIRSKSHSIKKIIVDQNLKRGSHLDYIDHEAKKFKPPGVAKFDLTKYTEFKPSKGSPAK